MRFLLLCCSLLLLFSACVPNKKYVYLQHNDVNKSGLPKDTALRSYDQVSFDYRIQPNDALYIRFESLTPEEFNFLNPPESGGTGGNMNIQLRSELVDPNGAIDFPGVGKVDVAGLTVFEIQSKLQSLAEGFLKSPAVKVRLVNFRYTLLGEVNQEGTITTMNNRISLAEAIGLGGGLTDLADKANIKLIRQKDGKTEVVYVNMLDEQFMTSPYYYINQNDVLIVPALKQRPFRRYFGQNIGIFLSATSIVLLIINLSK